ncbi:conserved hypothetical protein [Trichinella spiralis]|uniref:hypothetical protein n=1 Tax=Trichinella spiralis TaxID=6334 RepID=UPI0001EFD7D0|nr:conserved hypothetical protein [Trichinella spiralis]
MDIIVHLSKQHYFEDFPIFCSLIDHLLKELCENGLTMELKLKEESLEKSLKQVRGIYYKNMFIAQTLQAVKLKTIEKDLLERCIKEIMEFISNLERKLFAITSAAKKPLFSITNDDGNKIG